MNIGKSGRYVVQKNLTQLQQVCALKESRNGFGARPTAWLATAAKIRGAVYSRTFAIAMAFANSDAMNFSMLNSGEGSL
jgi:hypothetical protein